MDLHRYDVQVVTVTPGFVESRLTDQNTFAMPFKMTAEQAAVAITAGAGRWQDGDPFPAPPLDSDEVALGTAEAPLRGDC